MAKIRLRFTGVEEHIGKRFYVWRCDETGKRWAAEAGYWAARWAPR